MAPTSIEARFRVDWPGFTLDVDLALPGRGVTALFGSSGSGKTSLLRCMAGLERARGGRLVVNAEVWQDADRCLPTHKRPLGYVFQEASLFPHLSVLGNLRYGLRRSGATQQQGLDAAIDLLGIAHLLDRKPDTLSGGERQRVGIARALAVRPRLLLMDEPLAALDHKRKQEILPFLERLHDELEIPVIYVSHSPEEVARLADHLVLLEHGKVLASAPLGEALARLDLPLAREHEAGVVISAEVASHETEWHLTHLRFAGGNISVSQRPLEVGRAVRVRILARDVSIALSGDHASSIQNRFACTVTSIAPADDPAQCLVGLDAAGTRLFARVTRRAVSQLELAPGRWVWAQVKAVALLE